MAVPALGYVHRGLEALAQTRDFHQMVQVTERVCGICSVLHAICYCQGVEEIMGVTVPQRARYLRVVWVANQVRQIEPTLRDDFTVRRRTVGKGVITAALAHELGAVGPVLRASGIAQDIRQTGYAAYAELDFEPVTATAGDCHARCMVRLREIHQSIDPCISCLER